MKKETQAFKETAETISLHGLGFLQVKLGGKQRLHVWHPDLPRRACFEHSAVHSHRFSFMSRILVGTQRNILWSVSTDPKLEHTHVAYRHEGERSEFGNRPWIEDSFVLVGNPQPSDHGAGTRYVMKMHDYHSTEPLDDGRVATLMLKTAEDTTRGALSLCEIGIEPDVDFDRKQLSADQLWDVVREVLGG